MLIEIITFLNWLILWYFIVLSFGYIILLAASIPDVHRRYQEIDLTRLIHLTRSKSMPPITAIIPAYNEENIIMDTIQSLLNSTYTNLNIIIINAASTDNTLQLLMSKLELEKISPIFSPRLKLIGTIKDYYISKSHNNITVIDKEVRERSDAINAGLNACHTPLFMTIDADTIIEPRAISRIIFYMLSRPCTIAAGGLVNIINGCTVKDGNITDVKMKYNPILGFQINEYLRSFLFNRTGWNVLGGALSYAGAFTVIQHKEVMEIGGYDNYNAAQDFEIITHLHAYQRENNFHYNIGYTPAAAVWTDVPETLKEYWLQRSNWQDGILRSLMPYKRMLFNPSYGIVGLYTYPFFLFFETLSAIVEFTAYVLLILCWCLGILDVQWAFLFIILCIGFSTFLTTATTLMNFITFNQYRNIYDLFWLLFLTFVEPIGFRQFSIVCRVYATFRYFIRKLKFWGDNNDYSRRKNP